MVRTQVITTARREIERELALLAHAHRPINPGPQPPGPIGAWFAGDGLRACGIRPGRPVTADDLDAARLLLGRCDPSSGRNLVHRAARQHPAARLPAEPLLAAIDQLARDAAQTPTTLLAKPWAGARHARALRGRDREGSLHRISLTDADRLARAAGLELAAIYPPSAIEHARSQEARRVPVPAAYVFEVTATAGYSALFHQGDRTDRARFVRPLIDAGLEVAANADWTRYDLIPNQADGPVGLAGWVAPFLRPPRPARGSSCLLSVRILMLAAAHRSTHWSPLHPGPRVLARTAVLIEALVRARLRALAHAKLGIRWDYDPYTGRHDVEPASEAIGESERRPGITDNPTSSRRSDGGPYPAEESKKVWIRARESLGPRDLLRDGTARPSALLAAMLDATAVAGDLRALEQLLARAGSRLPAAHDP